MIGHNSGGVGGIASDHLRAFCERIELLEEEKTSLLADIRGVYAEAQGGGFDAKILRQVIKARRLEKSVRDEQDAIFGIYKRALDM